MAAWGFEVSLLAEDEVRRRAQRDGHCSTGKCRDRATHLTSYRYVTGRAGRVGSAERAVCTAHAERFAAKHEVEIGPPRAGRQTASQAAISAFLGGQQ